MSGQYIGTKYYYKPRRTVSAVTNTNAWTQRTGSRLTCLQSSRNCFIKAIAWPFDKLTNICRLRKKILIGALLALFLLCFLVRGRAVKPLEEDKEILELRGVSRDNNKDQAPLSKPMSNHFAKTCTIYDPAKKVNNPVELTRENIWNVTLMVAKLSLSPSELQLLALWMSSSQHAFDQKQAINALQIESSPQTTSSNRTFVPFVRIIHRTWKDADVPKKWLAGDKTCRESNPGWLYCHWTDDELEAFVRVEYPGFASTFSAYPHGIQRVDAARYLLLYHYAGVYLDLDIKCRQSFDLILSDVANYPEKSSENPLKLGPGSASGSDVILAEAEPIGVVGDFLAARSPGNPFLRHVVSHLRQSAHSFYPLPYLAVICGTGPIFLSNRVNDFQQDIDNYVNVIVVPNKLYNGVYFRHMVGGTWHSWDGRLIWKIYKWRRSAFVIMLLALFMLAGWLSLRYIRRRSRSGRRVIKESIG